MPTTKKRLRNFAEDAGEKPRHRMQRAIFVWAMRDYVRLNRNEGGYERRRNPHIKFAAVERRLWELYLETGDTSLLDCREAVLTSHRQNVPVPFAFAGRKSKTAEKIRIANLRLLLAQHMASILAPRRHYRFMQEFLDKKSLHRSATALPTRIKEIKDKIRKTGQTPELLIRNQIADYIAEQFPQKHRGKFGVLRFSDEKHVVRLNGRKFLVGGITSLSRDQERLLMQLIEEKTARRPVSAAASEGESRPARNH